MQMQLQTVCRTRHTAYITRRAVKQNLGSRMPLLQEADTDLKPVWEAGSGLSATEKAEARWMVGGRSVTP